MVRAARYAYVALAWIFLAALVVQVFLAGLGMFSTDPRDISLHVDLGWILHLAPILVLVAAAVGRVGRATLLWVGALLVSVLVQPFLALADDTSVVLAALHPVNALLMFAIALRLALASRAFLGDAPGPEAREAG